MRGAGLLPFRRRRAPRPVPGGERPYERQPGCGPDTGAFRRLGATFTPRPAPVTAPIVISPAPPARLAQVASTDPATLARAAGSLRQVDFAAVDAAKEVEGETHASARAARGPAPFGEYMDRYFIHPAWRHPLRGQVNLERVQAVPYPEPGKVADATDYAAAMRRLNQITGTHGWTPRRAITSGGAR